MKANLKMTKQMVKEFTNTRMAQDTKVTGETM
jgi:hypothetical protein